MKFLVNPSKFNKVADYIFKPILISSILLFSLDRFSNYLDYNYDYKAVYLISIVSFVGMFYLLSCYLLGILKLKNYKTN